MISQSSPLQNEVNINVSSSGIVPRKDVTKPDLEFIRNVTEKGVTENTTYFTSLNAEALVEEFDTCDRFDKKFIKKQLLYIPFTFRQKVKYTYNRFLKLPKKGAFEANTYLRKLGDYCRKLPIDTTWNDSQLKLVAKSRSEMCFQLASNLLHKGDDGEEVREHLGQVIRQHGLRPRKGKYIRGDVARYCCPKWWFKKLNRLQAISIEQVAYFVGAVSSKSQIYISDANFSAKREQRRRNSVFLQSLEAINEQGDCINLKEIADGNTSNPEIRRNELMARLHGFEVYADKHGYVADFVTLTCPSRMHSIHSTSGRPNKKYDGTTPKEAQKYFSHQWAKYRTHLARNDVDYFGFRVVEPHHDGTPHWHLLMFSKPTQRNLLIDSIREYALQVDGNEAGAQKRRCKIEHIIKAKGSAVGYIAKYISKNIDGFGIEKDTYGKPAATSAQRICEWSGIWGIRQFQQFGGPPVTIWREARRLALTEEVTISPIWRAADDGNWCEFIEALGGVNVKRKDLPVTIVKEFIEEEGEYWEPIGLVIKGLSCGGEFFLSRHHKWKVRKAENLKSSDFGESEA